jgi:hypothetical protein
LNVAVIPIEPGETQTSAVLRKVAAAAIDSVCEQLRSSKVDNEAVRAVLEPFLAGYLIGHARQAALKHGIDCEAEDGTAAMQSLAAEIGRQLPENLQLDVSGLTFVARASTDRSPRCRLRVTATATGPTGDAGYLVGHLEAVCEGRTLIHKAVARLCAGGPDAGSAYLTDCDVAADPMQTRAPTMSLRFTADERAVVLAGFNTIASS